jgi:uncharacterized protein YbjT (DUF2867 family)
VRAFVHRLDERSGRLRELGAEVVEGDLLDPASVSKAMQDIKRAYFTYPVDNGLLEATTIFALAAREAGTELVVNLSQRQGTAAIPSFRNLQHRLGDRIFDWAQVGAINLRAPVFFENVRALVGQSVAEQNTLFLPWGDGNAVIPLVGAADVARVAEALLAGPIAGRQNAYDLTGAIPTVNEIASTLGAVLKRPVRYVEISDERWRQAVEGRINPHALDHLSHLWQFFRTAGKEETGFRVGDAIPALTGSAPQTLEQFFRANAEALGGVPGPDLRARL